VALRGFSTARPACDRTTTAAAAPGERRVSEHVVFDAAWSDTSTVSVEAVPIQRWKDAHGSRRPIRNYRSGPAPGHHTGSCQERSFSGSNSAAGTRAAPDY